MFKSQAMKDQDNRLAAIVNRPLEVDDDERAMHVAEAHAERPSNAPAMTDKQEGFIRSLLDQVELSNEQRTEALTQLDDTTTPMSKSKASAWIERLLEIKKVSPKRASVDRDTMTVLPDVPAGRYAIDGDDGTIDFYKVDRPSEGRWAGYTFVKLLVADGGFGDDLAEQRIGFKQTRTILDRIIADGPRNAMERYGKSIGRCGHCGRTLTDNESIERGIGPVCAKGMGW